MATELEHFSLHGTPAALSLEPHGLCLPASARGHRAAFVRYDELTHLATSERFLWIAARRCMYRVPRERFRESNAPERVAAALLERVRALPGGSAQLEAMAAVEALAHRPVTPRATWALTAACVGVWILQNITPDVFTVGYFSPVLFADGDLWRIVTGNLLHGFFLHLALNVFVLVAVGRMVERALGTARTVLVMAASALCAMAVSGWVEPGGVVGVSGVFFGLAGSVLWIEHRHGAELPAWWRFPRWFMRLALVAIALDVALGFLLPFIAGEAHLGGLAGGILATAGITAGRKLRSPVGAGIRRLATAVVACTVLSVAVAGWQITGRDYMALHAQRLAGLPSIPPEELNNHAWMIAIGDDSTDAQMEAALLLAERAVRETHYAEPTILDTLAEVEFQLGHPLEALYAIEQAIVLAPDEPYYREQRRRFLGQRPANDRPPDPGLPPLRPRGPELPPDEEGLRV